MLKRYDCFRSYDYKKCGQVRRGEDLTALSLAQSQPNLQTLDNMSDELGCIYLWLGLV